IDHLNLSDANAAPMSDVFTRKADLTPYTAIIPGGLCSAPVDPALVPDCKSPNARLTAALPELHDAAWWAEALKPFDVHDADQIDAEAFNRVLWEGTMGDIPYPTTRSGKDLRGDRAQLLKTWIASTKR